MILLTVRDVTRQFDVSPVLDGVSFDVRPGEKIGLVGPNGAGKTTLLNILAGRDEPDIGQVERHPSAGIALLEQEVAVAPDRTLWDEVRSGLEHLYRLQTEAVELAHRMAEETDADSLDKLHRRYDQLQHDLHRLDAYHIDHRVEEVLIGLGFTPDEFHRPLNTFSGGQQNRALLARMLLRGPELMLLDEPTNHLDIAATEWLENYLARSSQSIILVSHDRYFLDRVTNRILELFEGTINDYRGNFSAYWHQREERNKVLRRTWEKQQEFIAKTEDFIRRNKYGQKHAQATDREKKLSRLEQVELPHDIPRLSMRFGEPTRTGDWVLEATDVSKGYDSPLFTGVNLRINRGDRVGVLGPNGSGKTTLLRVLIGELQPDTGKVRHGTGVKIGYYDQQLSTVEPDADPVEAIRPPDRPDVTPGPLRSLLAGFGIRGDMAFQQIGSMSGGEKSKVALAKLAALNANVLVLDEPTNHLDLWARDSLEGSLKGFDGTLLFVSHDRYFLDRVATHVIVFEPDRMAEPGTTTGGGGWRYYEGNYSDYVRFAENQQLEMQAADEKPVAPSPATDGRRDENKKEVRRKRRFPYRKVEDLEVEIAEQESLAERLLAEMSDPETHRDAEKVRQVTRRYEEAKAALEHLYQHWEEAVELN